MPNMGTRRGDIHSDAFHSSSARRRNVFVDENGMPVRNGEPRSDATFSNVQPGTSEAEALGGNSTRIIWGTNISIQDAMASFKNFLYNYARKYRLWADGASEDETRAMGASADEKEYIVMLNHMRQLGVVGLNLDIRNLKAFPPTVKLWHQVQAYPQEIIPLMDQCVKDVMLELTEEEIRATRQNNQQRRQGRPARDDESSAPIAPSSEFGQEPDVSAQQETRNALSEVESRSFKVLPFGMDESINMRDLDPKGKSQCILC